MSIYENETLGAQCPVEIDITLLAELNHRWSWCSINIARLRRLKAETEAGNHVSTVYFSLLNGLNPRFR